MVEPKSRIVRVWFEMDNVHIDFHSVKNKPFMYHPNPDLFQLNSESRGTPIRFKPGGVLAVEVLAFLCDSVLLYYFKTYIHATANYHKNFA